MLWKKESAKDNAVYVDVLAKAKNTDFDFDEINANMHLKFPAAIRSMIHLAPFVESEEISEKTRNYGNQSFGTGDWSKAIDWYNESMCSAPKGSKNIALAYANRASCFMKLKLYSEALIDIENAKQAGYPKELLPKLEQRKANCLKEMEDCTKSSKRFVEQLSYEPNENFPSMANVLNVTKDSAGKYSVIANEDIDVGQTVVVEKALFGCPLPRFGMKCNICLKKYTNLTACNKCTMALFCSAECQSNPIHQFECGVKFGQNMFGNRIMGGLRGILMAINLFPDVDALMNFVEQTRASDELLPATMKDAQSQYHAYIKGELCDVERKEMVSNVAPIYKKLMGIASVKEMFRAKKHERFLQHLIANHSLLSAETGRQHDERQAYVMMKYFRHSCTPNTISVDRNGCLVLITARPIKKGEELLDSTKCRERDCCGNNKHRVVCECKLCKGTAKQATLEERRKMKSDPKFKSIMAMGNPSDWENHREKVQAAINKCVYFLKEYGHVEWCNEIEKVMSVYRELLYVGFEKCTPYKTVKNN